MTTFRIPTGRGKAIPVLDARTYSWDLATDGLTQGLLQRFAACPEKHRLGQVQGYSSTRPRKALVFGNLVHGVLERLYKWKLARTASNTLEPPEHLVIEARLEEFWKTVCGAEYQRLRSEGSRYAEEEADLEENVSLSWPVLQGYLRQYWITDSGYELLDVERIFDVTRRNPYTKQEVRRRGKLDRVYRFNGKLWYLDIKTRGEIVESTIADRLKIDLQIAFYLDAMETVYGEQAFGAIHDIIRRPQLERKKSESLQEFSDRVTADIAKRPTFYYHRFENTPSPQERERFEMELGSRIKLLRSWGEGEFHYRDDSACTGRGYVCEFLPVCARGDYRGVKVRDVPFPELQEGKEDDA